MICPEGNVAALLPQGGAARGCKSVAGGRAAAPIGGGRGSAAFPGVRGRVRSRYGCKAKRNFVNNCVATIVTDATQNSTQITSELVVPGGLVESPFHGNLKICSSNLSVGTYSYPAPSH
jgi:hypothetical protein